MHQYYETRKRIGRGPLALRASLALVFLLTLGFAGGVLYLLLFLVPLEQRLVDRGISQDTVDLILAALVLAWILFGLAATAVYARLLLGRGRRLIGAALATLASVAAASFVFFFLLDNDLMAAAGQLGQQSAQTDQRIVYGPYPDAQQLDELRDEGYDGVIALLSPKIPFERVLLDKELENGEAAGIQVYSRPMLPWISGNEDSLAEIRALAEQRDKQFYIHCYLGKHRVDLVRQDLGAAEAEARNVALPERFERGRVASFDEDRVVLGPYPTDDEWFEYVLRRDVDEIVSTLDPSNPDDRPWIEQERRIAEENGVKFTLMPLKASPEPEAVAKVADRIAASDERIYVHDFLQAERFEALRVELERRMFGPPADSGSDGA